MMSLLSLVVFCLTAPRLVHSHYIWLRYDKTASAAVCTFGEGAQPGASFLLDQISPLIAAHEQQTPSAENMTDPRELAFDKVRLPRSMKAQLVAPVTKKAPLLLEGSATYGIFQEGDSPPSLLKYYFNADFVTKPSDWWDLQDSSTLPFEITLRDPYMLEEKVGSEVNNAFKVGDEIDEFQCPPGTPWYEGDFCLLGVVRYNGVPIGQNPDVGALNITTFDADGGKLRTQLTTTGVVILRFPNATKDLFSASVNFKEISPGTIDDKKYDYVDHWATTTSWLQR